MTVEASELPAPPDLSPFPPASAALAFADGASRGNPGPAAYGVAFCLPDGTPLCAEGQSLGQATNNVAEWRGLIAALRRLEHWGVREATVRLDSQLVVRQFEGRYKVKNAGLRPLYEQARQLAPSFTSLRVEHVPRAENALADAVANLALDRDPQAP